MIERDQRPTGLEAAPKSVPIGPEEEKMSQRLKWRAAGLAVAAPCLVLAACGQAQPEPISDNRTSQSTPAAQPNPRSAARRIDVEAIERQLAPKLSRASRDLVATPSPKGGARVDLAGRFQHMAIARQKADGTIERSCITTPGELSAVLRAASEGP
jgi:hypothetical protein